MERFHLEVLNQQHEGTDLGIVKCKNIDQNFDKQDYRDPVYPETKFEGF